MGKRSERANTVQKMYAHVYKCKNYTFETIPGIGE
jgi:hypothetical protein